ncbi:MAG: pilus assembly PilX N-terminal domain-containing protein [Candidatus Peregrinibacteria bacterium]|nr:pilus assembly PilX N-terminal domain-containing protein [Candidatus Peregrinibacteria bacterium]MDZ4244544.1 pilus assembly PilX N-terminal domain-containing protein [Candidatus Gracilibacteria bacterium]
MNKLVSKKGSALVMSLFFMSILIVLSFAVNYMLLNEVRSERNFLEGVKAYYSAEAGVEDALLQVSVNNAGEDISQTSSIPFVTDAFDEEDISQVSQSKYSYTVTARGGRNPCVFENKTADGFAVLKSGESVVIPLNGNNVFNVEYYIVNTAYPDNTTSNDPSLIMLNDVLRWKILGNRSLGDSLGALEAISDYFPINDVTHNTPDTPSTFGTSADALPFQKGKYYDIIEGATFDATADSLYLDIDAYSNNFADGGFHYIFHPDYMISDFLSSHGNNELMLTNYLNVIPPTDPELPLIYNANDYDLYYRVNPNPDIAAGERFTIACSAVHISADGHSPNEDFVQSIDVIRPLDQASPFTDFVWYQNQPEIH